MNSIKKQFVQKLSNIIAASLENDHKDNFDFMRFNGVEKQVVDREANIQYVMEHLDAFAEAYNVLSDEQSRDLYVLLTAFKMLGHRKVKLPFSNPKYFEERNKLIERVHQGNDVIDAGLFDWELYLSDLSFINIPIKLYARGSTIHIDYIVKQYEHQNSEVHIAVRPGDIVVDAGACWGNTALSFANIVGDSGRVFSFEFTENNLEIFKRNLSLNPDVARRIRLIEKAVWRNSTDVLYFNEWGPCTKVRECKEMSGKPVRTLSIDDFVKEEKLERVDFIKMDIEGAEQQAIAGAVKTLKKYKPRLAITLYHSLDDFVNIPRSLSAFALGYTFYLGHTTVHNEETVLFGVHNEDQ